MGIKIEIGVIGKVCVDFKSVQWRYQISKRKNRGRNNRELNIVLRDAWREMIVDIDNANSSLRGAVH